MATSTSPTRTSRFGDLWESLMESSFVSIIKDVSATLYEWFRYDATYYARFLFVAFFGSLIWLFCGFGGGDMRYLAAGGTLLVIVLTALRWLFVEKDADKEFGIGVIIVFTLAAIPLFIGAFYERHYGFSGEKVYAIVHREGIPSAEVLEKEGDGVWVWKSPLKEVFFISGDEHIPNYSLLDQAGQRWVLTCQQIVEKMNVATALAASREERCVLSFEVVEEEWRDYLSSTEGGNTREVIETIFFERLAERAKKIGITLRSLGALQPK